MSAPEIVALQAMQDRVAELEAENLTLRAQLAVHTKANCAAKLSRARAELRYFRELEEVIAAELERFTKLDRETQAARKKAAELLWNIKAHRSKEATP